MSIYSNVNQPDVLNLAEKPGEKNQRADKKFKKNLSNKLMIQNWQRLLHLEKNIRRAELKIRF